VRVFRPRDVCWIISVCRTAGQVQVCDDEAPRGGSRAERAATEPDGTGHEGETARVQGHGRATQTSGNSAR